MLKPGPKHVDKRQPCPQKSNTKSYYQAISGEGPAELATAVPCGHFLSGAPDSGVCFPHIPRVKILRTGVTECDLCTCAGRAGPGRAVDT